MTTSGGPGPVVDRPGQVSTVDVSGVPASSLRPRELQVLRLLARGLSAKEVAAEIGRTQTTVDNHMANAYGRLRVNSLVQAMNALGWVNTDETSWTMAAPVRWWVRT